MKFTLQADNVDFTIFENSHSKVFSTGSTGVKILGIDIDSRFTHE